MDLAQRLNHLEAVRDWQGLADELEKQLASETDPVAKANCHLRLGRLLDEKFLQGVKALKHLQDAFKLNSGLTEALRAARLVYWELGKTNMVQRLLELELKAIGDGPDAAPLLVELADVYGDLGEHDKAVETYARALGASGGASEEARAGLTDAQADQDGWEAHVASLLQQANDASSSGVDRARCFLRAARLARRFAPTEFESLLARAYETNPIDRQAAALYESILAEEDRLQGLVELQRRVLDGLSGADRAAAALRYGARWATRHQNAEIGSKLLEEVLEYDPRAEGAFSFLRDLWGAKEGDWDRVAKLADKLLAKGASDSAFMLAQAGTIAWQHLGNIALARGSFEKLTNVAPDHPVLKLFESQTGERLGAGSASASGAAATESTAGVAATKAEVAVSTAVDEGGEESTVVVEEEADQVDWAKIEELKAKAAKQEAAKRYNEYVKTLIELAEAMPDASDKIDYYSKAAELYTGKFSNAAEAVKCFEAILAIDGANAPAIKYLQESYEKRRDWEKLIGLNKRQASLMPPGSARADRFLEIAKLATERVKKPEVCIELWDEVLRDDPENVEALNALSGLYERAKDWDKLAAILQTQVEVTADFKAKETLLGKLGALYGERINNDDAAIEAWQQLLTLNPSERKAQEALKKLYLKVARWDDLEPFYAEGGKWDEFIRVLEGQKAKESDDKNKISLLMKTARLWLEQKQKADRAMKAYEEVWTIDASYLPAAEALIPLYTQSNNAKGLATAIEVKLSHDQDPLTRLDLYREVAALYETKLKEPQKAFERFLSAFEIAPGDTQCIDDVERVARATGSWEALIASYRKMIEEADAESDRDLGIALRLRLGSVLVDEVNRIDDALAQFRAVYDTDSENAEAISALERLYRSTSRFNELLEIQKRKLELADDTEAKKTIRYAIAELFVNELSDRGSAIATYNEVLEDDPADAPALEALDTLYRLQEQWEQYVDVLKRRIELNLGDAVTVDLKYRLGSTLEKHLQDPHGALENYREILALDPTHEGARLSLEALLENEELRAEAAEILQEIYESRGDWEKLIQSLEILAAAEGDVSARVNLLRKVARVAAENLSSLERAFEAQSRALRDDPSNADTRGELEQFAAQANSWDKLFAVFSEIAGGLSDERLAREYWMRLAGISEKLGKVEDAANGYKRVLEIDPADAEALSGMDALYTRTERWQDLIEVYRRRIAIAPEFTDREVLFDQMAIVYEEKLSRPEDAIAAYQEVLREDPTSHVALTKLDGLFSRQSMWQDLADNLEQQLRYATEDEEQIRLMLRLASLRETKMDLLDTAIEGYRQVLEREPSNAEALSALERLGKLSEYEEKIAEILEPLYRASGDFMKLIGVHEVQVRRTDDLSRKVELLHQIATLYEDAGGDLNAAFDTHARALAHDPALDTTQQALDRLARATGRLADQAKVLEDLAAAQQEPELGSQLFMMSARVYEELGDVESAIKHYRTVLRIDTHNLAAAEALENLFRAAERYPELSEVLQQKAEILDEFGEKKSALFQAASIEEDVLQKHDAAIAVYGKILDLDPEDLSAIDQLINLYLGLSRWQDLLAVYTKKIELVPDTEEKKSIYYQMGAVYESEQKDVPAAIDTYQRVLELDPDDLQALGRLDVLFQQSENWPELLGILEHLSRITGDPAEQISYNYRIAELYEKHLNDVQRAIELYRDLLAVMPDHEPTLIALEGIKSGDRDPLGAALVLEPIYDTAQSWDKLISVLEVQVTKADDQYARVDLLHRIARLHEEMLGNHQAAFDTYARAVTFDITNQDSLANIERLAGYVSRWKDVAALYDAELNKLGEQPDLFVELGLRLAGIFETQLEDVDNAVARYRRVLEVDAENIQAISSLDRLFMMTERWTDLVPVLAREAEIASGEESLEFKYRLGQIYELQLDDLGAAIAAYREVLTNAPDHRTTLEALEGLFGRGIRQLEIGETLEPLYETSNEWEKLLGVLEAKLTHLKEPEERRAMYYRMAETYEERLVALDGALGIYVRALKEYPTDEKTLEEIERLGRVTDGGWEAVANAYADVLGLHADKDVQTSTGLRLARVFEEELGDITKAEETYRYVLGVEPLEPKALVELDRIYSSLESWAELAQILEQRVKVPLEPYELIELWGRLGQVYEEQLGQVDDAIRAFRRLFDELEPQNEAAVYALERLYGVKGSWNDLMNVYNRELEITTNERDVRAKMARLLAAPEHLNNITAAIDMWKQVLDLGVDTEALFALANLYERESRWGELCEVLEQQFDAEETDEGRVAVLLRRAKLYNDQLNRDDLALDDYNRALDIEYANAEALYAIAEIWRKRTTHEGQPNELVTVLHQTVDRCSGFLPPENMIALYRELGLTYQNVLQQPYDAIDAWRKLLAVDPRDFEAMAALENLLRAEERWVEVIDVKMGRAAAYEDPQEKVREYLEVADIWEHQVYDKDKGTVAYEKVLEIEPTHDRAYLALEELHAVAHRAEPLIELYLARLDTREDTNEKTEILRKVAKVFEEELDDKPQAFDALMTAFELDYDNMDTVRYLERMAQATNRWPELVQNANRWLQAETQPLPTITLCLHLAKWYAEDLGHPEYSQPYYMKVRTIDPNNVSVLRQMANFHKKGGQWQQQGQLLQQARDIAVKDTDRKEVLTELGEVLEKNVDVDQGVSFYKQALDVDAYHLPALDALDRIYTDRNLLNELVDILTRKGKSQTDPAQIALTKLRCAGIYEKDLNLIEKAGQIYREVLEVDASNLQAMRGLERVYNQTHQWPDLVGVLEMQLDVVTTERERIEVLLKIAKNQEEQFLKPDLAAVRLEQVVDIDPHHEFALESLERCYRRLRQWHDLINTYDRHINATIDRQKKIELWAHTAKVYAEELQDFDKAIDSWLNITDLDDKHITALEALAKLYEKQDDSHRAIEYMTRVADLTADGKQRVEMYYRIGKQLEDKLGDRVLAQDRFQMALDLDPTHVPSLAALRVIAIDSADWVAAERYLDQEQQNTELPRPRAKLLVELGKLRDDMLGEHELAVQAYELALQSDADNEDAAMPLLDEYVNTEKWAKAEPLAEMLVKKSGKREKPEQHRLQNIFGKVLVALGKFEPALKAYQAAYQLDLTSQETIRGLADVCFKLSDWAGALTNYQKVLTSLGEEETEERANVYYKLGLIKQAQGQAKQAINNFEKALGVEPAHRPTLDAMVGVYDNLKDWKQVAHYKRQILDNIIDGAERFKVLQEIADTWEKDQNSPKAVEALEEALDLEPQNHKLLHTLLALYQKLSHWEKMVECLQRIADLEPQPKRKSRYFFTMAQIYRDKLEDMNRAVDLFNDALDLDPGFLDAFERINKILTAQKEWKQLERAYRKMIHRVAGKGNVDLEFTLWHALGLIYRDRLEDHEKAVETFRISSRLKPDDTQEHLILAQLFTSLAQNDEAIGEYQALVKIDPTSADTYHKLYQLYVEQKAYDPAWCTAAALALLRKSEEDEQKFFEDYRPQGMLQVKSRLDNEAWLRNLFHEEENLYIGKIFEMIASAALKAKIMTLEAKKERPVLDPRFRQDPATSTVTFARTFGWASQVLGISCPALYVRSDVPGALVAVPAEPPSSVAGQTVLTGFSPQELTFIIGKHLAMYRGEHYIKTLFPTVTELTVLLFAAMKLVQPDTPSPPDIEKQVLATAQTIKQFMQPVQLEGLRMVVKKFVADGAKANLKRWSQCVDITATRAGFLLCGDLEIAKKIIASEPQQPGDLPPQEKLKELLLFSVSEQYFTLRQSLGIAIGSE
ncbi:MAG: tetratricopeptide repeat protein [Polyangiaceae bacterium]|nr:tetratricopeptide repeat protein [Polyangiaceae bacterium]